MYRKEQTVLLHCIMINMQQGRIIKIISNQYTIQNEKEEIIAKPRGKMRQQQTPVVGDFVEYENTKRLDMMWYSQIQVVMIENCRKF